MGKYYWGRFNSQPTRPTVGIAFATGHPSTPMHLGGAMAVNYRSVVYIDLLFCLFFCALQFHDIHLNMMVYLIAVTDLLAVTICTDRRMLYACNYTQ